MNSQALLDRHIKRYLEQSVEYEITQKHANRILERLIQKIRKSLIIFVGKIKKNNE